MSTDELLTEDSVRLIATTLSGKIVLIKSHRNLGAPEVGYSTPYSDMMWV